jgi:hypothetical protein
MGEGPAALITCVNHHLTTRQQPQRLREVVTYRGDLPSPATGDPVWGPCRALGAKPLRVLIIQGTGGNAAKPLRVLISQKISADASHKKLQNPVLQFGNN